MHVIHLSQLNIESKKTIFSNRSRSSKEVLPEFFLLSDSAKVSISFCLLCQKLCCFLSCSKHGYCNFRGKVGDGGGGEKNTLPKCFCHLSEKSFYKFAKCALPML